MVELAEPAGEKWPYWDCSHPDWPHQPYAQVSGLTSLWHRRCSPKGYPHLQRCSRLGRHRTPDNRPTSWGWLCWSEPPKTIPLQRGKGAFTHVISYLENLAQHLPTRKVWDELVCLPPSAVPCTPYQSRHLSYIQGQVMELGPALPSTQFYISQPGRQFVCAAWGLLFEGSMLAYDPVSNEAEWIPV